MLTAKQETIIEELVEYGSNRFGFNTDRTAHLLLVCTGDRPGCLFTVKNKEQLEFIKGKIDKLDLYYKEQKRGLYITNNKSLMQDFSKSDTYSIGTLCGYPEQAIEFYQDSDYPVSDFDLFIKNETNYSLKEFDDKTSCIEYIPSPTQEGIEEALQRQQKYESTITSYSSIIPIRFI